MMRWDRAHVCRPVVRSSGVNPVGSAASISVGLSNFSGAFRPEETQEEQQEEEQEQEEQQQEEEQQEQQEEEQ